MTSNKDRNSLQRGERTDPGTILSRQMVWSKTPQLEAWTCVGCGWVFIPLGPPLGNSLDEMMLNFELLRDKEYACHVCARNPRGSSNFPGRLEDRTHASMAAGPLGRNDMREGL